jgi:hypothetical protein
VADCEVEQMIPLLLSTVFMGQAELPNPDQYIQVKGGQLVAQGKRVRLWCVIGGFPNPSGIQEGDSPSVKAEKKARAYKDAEAALDRFSGLGFNGIRLWEKPSGSYTKGDGSNSDVLDYFVSEAKERGFRIWVASVSTAPLRPEDSQLAGEASTEAAWREAAKAAGNSSYLARVWDPRLEAAMVRHMEGLTGHVNQHTGLRWGDDPVFGIWELSNEEWWMSKMMNGAWSKLPPFFQASLRERWHDYLRRTHGGDEGLRRAWGFLLPDESLERGTVQIGPVAGDVPIDFSGMDQQARIQLQQGRGEGRWRREDFNRRRSEDVIAFFLEMQLAHKGRLKDALKKMGRSAQLGPVLYDTGIGYEAQSQFLHQNAEAVSHNAYINGTTSTIQNQRYPWYSGLEEWPRISLDLPWLEHNRVEGKPFLCYETQIMQPAKYRAEYPLRLLALAAIQDWDAICWHYWGSVPDITSSSDPFNKPMDMTTGWHPQGYHFTYDAVQNSIMRAAAHAFRSGSLKPAPSPTKFIFGRRSLYDPASMDYGGSYGKLGNRLLPTTYAHGVRMEIDPTRETDEVKGPSIDPLAQGLPNIIKSTPEITFDVAKGGLTFDSPGAVGFTGFLANFPSPLRFKNGLSLDKVKVAVPAKMPYGEGLAEEKYVAFLLSSEDGLPISQSKRATLSFKSSSFNSGFELLMKEDSLAKGGDLPVLEARPSGILQGAPLAGMNWEMIDWSFRSLGKGRIGADGKLTIPSDKPVWVIRLTR